MAKGLEDTAHYRYFPLASFNEVGCEPLLEAGGAEAFFSWLNECARDLPMTMKASSTHDTKRAEDVRYRLMALSEMPEEWISFVRESWKINAASMEGISAPVAYLLFQTLVGSWPGVDGVDDAYIKRIQDYMLKAGREAKLETSWMNNNGAYEEKLAACAAGILKDREFLHRIDGFVQRARYVGALKSLTALTMRVLSPGIADFYQGTELWALSLVDPDNRRPVDYESRIRMLEELDAYEEGHGRAALLEKLCTEWEGGAVKLWLTRMLLGVFNTEFSGSHEGLRVRPVALEGDGAGDFLAYFMENDISQILVTCPRFLSGVFPEKFGRLSVDVHTNIMFSSGDFHSHENFYDFVNKREITLSSFLLNSEMSSFPVSVIKFL